jgi:hypothetical protein
MAEIYTLTEPVGPWMPLTCIGCPKPTSLQQVAYFGGVRLPVKVPHCGDEACEKEADQRALGIVKCFDLQAIELAIVTGW